MSTTAKPKSSFLATMMSNTQIYPIAVTPPSEAPVSSPAPSTAPSPAKKPVKQQNPADSFEEGASIRTTIYLPRKVSQELDYVRARYRVTRTGSIINALDAMRIFVPPAMRKSISRTARMGKATIAPAVPN